MATHKISVTVDERSIRVEPDELRMTAKDEVHWAGTNDMKFLIEFDDKSPFADRTLQHDRAVQAQKPDSRGYFKYTVVSAADPKLRLDPVIIVEEPESEG